MKTIYQSTLSLRNSGHFFELFGVIIEMLMSFFVRNLLKDGKLTVPKKFNLVFLYQTGKLVIKIAKCIRLYKLDYSAFKKKYLDVEINPDLVNFNQYFTNQ